MNVVTRFAPSPTGYLHVGGLRTALYSYLFAKQQKGTFILRIEDTDQTRLVPGAVEALITTLTTMGLPPDKGPFIQSERLALYREHTQRLLDHGHAYYCFCSKERLLVLREEQQATKSPMKYDRACLHLSKEDIDQKLAENVPHVVRLLVPEGKTTFTDEIRGEITIENKEVDDQVLLKTDGFPTYHLAVVVDDNDMAVTHIIRGDEWISSVPKHIILYNMFGFPIPKFAHLPLILNPDKSKLSKRQGDVAVEDYLAKGFLKEALINFVALLGFNPTADREIYTLEELIAFFDLSKINKSGAVFDHDKLNWMNGMYLRTKTTQELIELSKPFLKTSNVIIDDAFFARIVEIEKERLVTLQELADRAQEYSQTIAYDASLLIWKKADTEDAKMHLIALKSVIANLDESVFSDRALVETAIKKYIEEGSFQNGNVLWPLRAALSNKEKSPNPFELIWMFGKDESLKRIDQALSLLK
ncbi:glutamate--tRNA ligase [Candidatus Uhrbacteria bacterium RIFOXYB2_FULL_45_11]|uniref:Glutamate--tRNA ligase n=1 Tax=Candidatus Uhrbacteria bacterium RIFOXYB2_FULL_45_11 TaxID=1802421 RepID=A0A1F7W751_9BACT|nr:MAG: glutamate--tRNA ligase [Candidatus Uhrbacteria bacterium RIFOXYB2_FULL_45_11]